MQTNRPLAVVGTTAITEADVTEAILNLGANAAAYNTPEGRAAILNQLIEQALFLTDARKNMLEYDPLFKEQLAKIKDELLVQFAISKAIDKVNVTDAEMKAYFTEHPEQFASQETVTASHILVGDEATAKSLLERIRSGEIAFEDAARQYSTCPSAPHGGSLGEFARGQMVPEFENAAFSMEAGALSEPVRTQFGYHIIRVDARGNADAVTFEEAKDAIRDLLLNEKRKAAYQSKVNQMKIMYPVQR